MADKVDITFLEPSADVSVVQIEAETAYQLVNGSIAWVEAQATEVVLDPDTKNRYFRDEAFSLSEQASLHSQKVTLDSFGFSDQQIFDVTKGIADQLSFSDVVDILLIIERDFSDAYTLADVSVLAVDKGVAETLSFSEVTAFALDVAKADSVSILESAALALSKPAADSLSINDTFSRVATFSRAFTDAFALDDAATVDAFTKDTSAAKTNVFGFTDTQTFAVEKPFADSASLTDSFSFSVDLPASDSVTLSDSVVINLISSNQAVLNSSALNTFTLNS